MSPLWTSDAIAAATGGVVKTAFDVSGISIDSRSIRKGDLFVALTDQRDGHEFVANALRAGAASALVSRVPEGVAPDAPLCVVVDVALALEGLGRAGRARSRAQVIAITGSAGKTSTKDMLLSVLGRQGRTHGSEASFNNQWGVPLTLARLPADTDTAVIEIGMNRPGEIAPLAKMAVPHVAIVTTVAVAHLEAFSGIEDIAREKGAIFEGLTGGDTAIVNADLPVTTILREAAAHSGATLCLFGESQDADFRATAIHLHDALTVVETQTPDGPLLFKVNAPGRHFALNALSVLAAVCAVGADPVLAATDLGQWIVPAGRGAREVVELDPVDERLAVELIDDAYNANPASMEAGLAVLAAATPRQAMAQHSRGRRIAVLGDMLELGRDEAALHAQLAQLPPFAQIAKVHCVGPLMRNLFEALPEHQRGRWTQTADELVAIAGTLFEAGDVVLVKGSKSSYVSRVVDAIRKLGHAQARQDTQEQGKNYAV